MSSWTREVAKKPPSAATPFVPLSTPRTALANSIVQEVVPWPSPLTRSNNPVSRQEPEPFAAVAPVAPGEVRGFPSPVLTPEQRRAQRVRANPIVAVEVPVTPASTEVRGFPSPILTAAQRRAQQARPNPITAPAAPAAPTNSLEVRGFPSPIPTRKPAAAAATPAPKAEPKPQKVELLTVTQLPAAESPDVTVVIPLITSIDFLEDALLSVKRQTYTKWAGVIGSVGQTEANQNKIKALINNSGLNNRFAVVDLATGTGIPGVLTRISSDATTRFVAVLEASDIWLPKKLELQVKQATADSVGIVGTLYREFGESNKPVNLPVGKIYRADLEKGNPLLLSSVLIASDIAVFTDEFTSFDYDCWVRNHLKGVPIANLDSIQVLHRITRTTMFNPVDKQPEQIREKYFVVNDDDA